jgi:hypothetical protein
VFYIERRMAGWAATGHGCVEYAKGDTICPLWSRRLLAQQLGPSGEDRARERLPQATLEALSPELAQIPYAERPPPRPSLSAWEVLDRHRVERRLAQDPGSLDRRERRHVWRLATVFMALHPA